MCVALAGGVITGLSTIPDVMGQFQDQVAKDKEHAANLRIALSAKADAEARGGIDAGKARMAGSQLVEQQKVAYAASGVDPTMGTAANVMADTRAMSELEAQTLKNNAAREAWGYQEKASSIKRQRKQDWRAFDAKASNTALSNISRMLGSAGGAGT